MVPVPVTAAGRGESPGYKEAGRTWRGLVQEIRPEGVFSRSNPTHEADGQNSTARDSWSPSQTPPPGSGSSTGTQGHGRGARWPGWTLSSSERPQATRQSRRDGAGIRTQSKHFLRGREHRRPEPRLPGGGSTVRAVPTTPDTADTQILTLYRHHAEQADRETEKGSHQWAAPARPASLSVNKLRFCTILGTPRTCVHSAVTDAV